MEIEALTKQILERITPKSNERENVNALSHKLEKQITAVCQTEGIAATVRVEGSVAKDTWLSENPDIDVFIRLPTSIPRKNLGEVGLKIAKKAVGKAKKLERFAEHPYLEVEIDGFKVDIVPCYDTKPSERQSATDRTPYHTDYIKSHLKKGLLCEVRLLKRFMQGIGVYGAEIKVGGFSGYLCELLILKYGSFLETIKAFADYNQRVTIDIEDYYVNRTRDLLLLFPEPLVIIDPVDEARNVASAVKPQKLYELISAAREFLKEPKEQFFYPTKTKILSTKALTRKLEQRGSRLVFLVINQVTAVSDVLWGQLYRSERSIRSLFKLNDFKVLRDAVWSNEENLSVFIFELEEIILPNNKKHLGPPLERKEECEEYLEKYSCNKKVISGPYIEDYRWVVQLQRKTNDAIILLKNELSDGGRNSGIAELIVKSIKEGFKVQVDREIIETYSLNKDFSRFLTEFIAGKPFWLKT